HRMTGSEQQPGMSAAATGEVQHRALARDQRREPGDPGRRGATLIGLMHFDLWRLPARRANTVFHVASGCPNRDKRFTNAMIVYKLCCKKDHEFEAWFRDSSAA